MDNGTSEYVFITTFFAPEPVLSPVDTPQVISSHLFSPISPGDDQVSSPATDSVPATARPRDRTDSVFSNESLRPAFQLSKEDQASLNAIWKQIMDPALEYTKVGPSLAVVLYILFIGQRAQTFVQAALEPPPPAIPLLTMIRLTEEVMGEVQKRGCQPLETFVFGLRLQMWPLFQKAMTDQIEGLKKVAEGAGGGYFRRTATTSDTAVATVSVKTLSV
jgi:vacuolar protein sorting-associated protein 52